MAKTNKTYLFILILFFMFAFAGAVFAGGTRKIANPGYWIDKVSNPDAIELTEAQIAELNSIITEKTYQMADVLSMPDTLSKDVVAEWLSADPLPDPSASASNDQIRYDLKGRKVKKAFYDKIAENVDFASISDAVVRFGVIAKRADIRAVPSDDAVYKKKGGTGFDAFQYSSVYPPEAVALVHVSKDKLWGFFQSSAVRGWIRLNNVAFGNKNEIASAKGSSLVVTDSRIKVFSDESLKKALSVVPMGTELAAWGASNAPDHSTQKSSDAIAIRFPSTKDNTLVWIKAYVKPQGVNAGYLPYTPRNTITQAFKMLGEPYGWGGVKGKRDCSTFVRDVYSTMGIRLPRNSRQQSLAALFQEHVAEFFNYDELNGALHGVRAGATIIALNGHIMLYLGTINGRPYVIHQTYGFVKNGKLKVINSTVVTDVEMYANNRIKSVTEITLPKRAQSASLGL